MDMWKKGLIYRIGHFGLSLWVGWAMALLLSLIPLHGYAQTSSKVYLVAAGVADYPGSYMDLGLPANDAQAICDLYRKNGKSNVYLLTNEQATVKNILSTTEKVFKKAKQNDIVIFFFSGHGGKGLFCAYDDNLSFTRLREVFAGCKAKNKMIMADACHSGSLRQTKESKQPAMGNVMVFLSSRTEETSMERPIMKNGFFTHSLLQAMRGKADANKNRIVTAKELFDYVSKDVKNMTQDKQHPVMWGNFKDDMPVIIW